uniref:Uncharacterized protein n=1 Tax=Manihot esculenta TaxID=3983 RepID=A0A251LQJ0_MANES
MVIMAPEAEAQKTQTGRQGHTSLFSWYILLWGSSSLIQAMVNLTWLRKFLSSLFPPIYFVACAGSTTSSVLVLSRWLLLGSVSFLP